MVRHPSVLLPLSSSRGRASQLLSFISATGKQRVEKPSTAWGTDESLPHFINMEEDHEVVPDLHVTEDQGTNLDEESLLPRHFVGHHSKNQLFDVTSLILVGYLEPIDLDGNYQ